MELRVLFSREELGQNLAAFLTWIAVATFDVMNPPALSLLPLIVVLHLFFVVTIFSLHPKLLRKDIGPKEVFMVSLSLICIFGLTLIYKAHSLDHILLILVAASLPHMLQVRTGYLIIGFSLIVFAVILFYYYKLSEAWMIMAYSAGFVLFAYQNSVQRVITEKTQSELEDRNQQLVKARDLLAQKSRSEERLRISRDLHDILGHQLTALNLNLETAFHKTPIENRSYIETCRNLARELLQDVRGVVRTIRDESIQDLKTSLVKMGHQFPELALKIDFDGIPTLTNPLLIESLVRCSQEAITNAVKHGNATQIDISANLTDDCFNLIIQDDGKADKKGDTGNGLTGMQERLKSFEGNLILSQQPDCGWTVVFSIPRQNM